MKQIKKTNDKTEAEIAYDKLVKAQYLWEHCWKDLCEARKVFDRKVKESERKKVILKIVK